MNPQTELDSLENDIKTALEWSEQDQSSEGDFGRGKIAGKIAGLKEALRLVKLQKEKSSI